LANLSTSDGKELISHALPRQSTGAVIRILVFSILMSAGMILLKSCVQTELAWAYGLCEANDDSI